MSKLKGPIYYPLVVIFVLLGLTFSIILTYNHYARYKSQLGLEVKKIEIFCGKKKESDQYVDCDKVGTSAFSTFPGNVPISLWGVGFFLMAILYYLFPTMNPNSENYLKVPFFYLLLFANLLNIGLFLITLLIIKAVCGQCIAIYISTLALLILLFLREFSFNTLVKDSINYFGQLKNDLFQKELAMFMVLSLLLFSMLFLFNNNQVLALRLIFERSKQSNIAKELNKRKDNFLKMPVLTIDSKNDPVYGKPDAPITLVVYHDLQCPVCRKSFFKLEKIVDEYQPLVQIRYKNYAFLSSGSHSSQLSSLQLAQYAMAAHEKGMYHKFVSELFKRLEKKVYINKTQLADIFKSIQFPMTFDEIEKNLSKYMPAIQKEITEGDQHFIKSGKKNGGTPALFLNNRLLMVGFNDVVIKNMLDNEVFQLAKEKLAKENKQAGNNKQE